MFEDSIRRRPSDYSRRRAAWGSAVAHAGLTLVSAWIVALPRQNTAPPTQVRSTPDVELVWIATPGPSGGGGSGGNEEADTAPAQAIGQDRTTVPPAPPKLQSEPSAPEPPPDPVEVPAVPAAAGLENLTGLLTPVEPATTQGAGSDGGAGSNGSRGLGDGRGPGVGSGVDGGIGTDAVKPGNGVSTPLLLREVKPAYTADAMRAKVQGVVLLECVVLPNGNVGNIKIIRSLDTMFGLDEEAIKAAREWRFEPGRRLGKPVAVRVVIELGFRLR